MLTKITGVISLLGGITAITLGVIATIQTSSWDYIFMGILAGSLAIGLGIILIVFISSLEKYT